MDWFLYDNGLRHERVKYANTQIYFLHVYLFRSMVRLLIFQWYDIDSKYWKTLKQIVT